MLEGLSQLDVFLFYLINHAPHTELSNSLAIFIDVIIGFGIFFIAMFLIVFIVDKSRYLEFIILGGAAIALSFLVSSVVLKNLIQRPRPFETLDNVILLGLPLGEYSFPSGHTTTIFAFLVISIFLFGSKGKLVIPIIAVVALLTAFGRIYVGHHYPSDVVAGALIGTIVALILYYVVLIFMKNVAKDKKEMIN